MTGNQKLDAEVFQGLLRDAVPGLVKAFQVLDDRVDRDAEFVERLDQWPAIQTWRTGNIENYIAGNLEIGCHGSVRRKGGHSPPYNFHASFERPWIGVFDVESLDASAFENSHLDAPEHLKQWQLLVLLRIRQFVHHPERCRWGILAPKRLKVLDESLNICSDPSDFLQSGCLEIALFDENGKLRSSYRPTGCVDRQMMNGIVEGAPQMMRDFAGDQGPACRDRFDLLDFAELLSRVEIGFDGDCVGLSLKPSDNIVFESIELFARAKEPVYRIGEWGRFGQISVHPRSSLSVVYRDRTKSTGECQ
jgi:hypothetical protein